MRAYPARLATPSCTRAPPESLMNTNGVPVFIAAFMVSAILLACTSPAEPPATVKSWLARWTGRPPMRPRPVTTPSAGKTFSPTPKKPPLCFAEDPAVVLGEQPRFLKGIAVQHQRHALPRGKFSALVLLGGALRPAPQFEPVPGLPELRSLVGGHLVCSPAGSPLCN